MRADPGGSGQPAVPVGWSSRLFERPAIPPPIVGALVAIAYLAVVFGGLAAMGFADALETGSLPPWNVDLLWDNLVTALLCAYVPIVAAYGRRGARADLEALRPVLRDPARATAEVLAIDTAFRRRAAWIAVAVGFSGQLAIALAYDRFDDPGTTLRAWVDQLRIPVLVWFVFHAAHLEVAMLRSFYRLGARGVEVDLLDPLPLAPFSRHGLRSALLWFGALCVFSLFKLGRSSGVLDWLWLLLLVCFATACLLVPVLGVHSRLRAAKREELARIRASLARESRAVGPGEERLAVARQLAPLLAYEARVQSVREWPFDAFTLVRFFLYASVGIGSWLGAALVERALEWLLAGSP